MSLLEERRKKIASSVFKEMWRFYKRTITFSRSLCLKLAWRTVRSKARIYKSKVRGVSFEPRQKLLRKLLNYNESSIKLFFMRDYDNMYDNNAISVIATVTGKGSAPIGYVSKEIAEIIAPKLDNGYIAVVLFDRVTGNEPGKKYLGCNFSYALIQEKNHLQK